MARPTERRRTQREQAELQSQRPVQLQPDRRFLAAGGHDRNVRIARALENAFKVGTQGYVDIKSADNAEQRQRAINERGAGMAQDMDEKSLAYHRQWDELNADYDFQKLQVDLPEALTKAKWEDLPEKEVQGMISSTMQGMFAGIENMKDSAYASYLAPRLMELEAKLVGQHRQVQIEKDREEKRTQTFATFTGDYESRFKAWQDAGSPPDQQPLPDYQTLFTRTGTFFDGAEKKTIFWESVYDLAIQMGDSSIIDRVPPVMNGVPSGIEDPKLADAHRQARNAADTVAARRDADAQAEQTLAFKQEVFDLQHAIALKTIAGQDVSEELMRLRNNPEAKYSNYTSATTFAQGQFDRAEQRAAQLPELATLWNSVYSGKAGLDEAMQAWEDGVFGAGPQAVAQMEKVMETVKQVRDASQRADSSLLTQTRSTLAANYNPQREGLLKGINPDLLYIQTSAVEEFNQLTLVDGVAPLEAARQVREKYDPYVSTMTNAESSSEFAARAGTGAFNAKSARAFLTGELDRDGFLRSNTRTVVEKTTIQLVDSGELSPEEADLLLEALY